MLSFLFKKKEKENETIKFFQEEHQALLQMYNDILALANESKFSELKSQIPMFVNTFMEHIKKEADEIYTFLENNLDINKDGLLLNEIKSIKKDMIPIRKKVDILHLKYRELDSKNVRNFIEDFNYLGGVLLKRIEIEEHKLFQYYLKKQKR